MKASPGVGGAVPELHFPFYSVLIIIIMKCVSLIDNKANLSVVSAMSANTISSIDILAPVKWCCCNASTSLSGFECCASYRTLRGTATVCPLPRGNHSKNCGITTHEMKHIYLRPDLANARFSDRTDCQSEIIWSRDEDDDLGPGIGLGHTTHSPLNLQ